MSDILVRVHSLIPYLFLLLMLVVLAMSVGAMPKSKMSKTHFSLARVTMIIAHIQLLFGLLVLFLSDAAQGAWSLGMGEVMKNAELRNRFVEHPMMMIIGIALITIGFSRAKRTDDGKKKNKNILIFYGIGFVVILSRIPFAQWLNL